MKIRGWKMEDGSWRQRKQPRPDGANYKWSVLALRLSVAAGLLLLSLGGAFAQNYAIDWWTIDGGGGTSTGGVYSVTGTIGQPDAGSTAMTGGAYSVTGGFWALAAVQTPGAPLLSIARTTTNTVAVWWPSPSTDWVLQENTNSMTSMNWNDVVATPVDDGTHKTVIISPPTGNRFYRLFQP